MFASLSDRLGGVLQKVRGQGRITEYNVKDTLREVRMALLEADVALPVVKQLVDQVRDKALGEEVLRSLTPGQALVKIVNDELVRLMGEANEQLDLAAQPPADAILISNDRNEIVPLFYLQAVEERAREELGMLKEGETFYQIVDEPGPAEER